MFARLTSSPKNYDWGTPDAMSIFTNTPVTGLPEAELWFGAHPLAGSVIHAHDGDHDFASWLESGEEKFPLLVKLLAASQPLSIQVHPTQAQAQGGFRAEEDSGIPLNSPQRTYKDSNAKPEVLIALSESFDVLWGFTPLRAWDAKVDRWENAGLKAPGVQGLRDLRGETLRDTVGRIFSNTETVTQVLDELAQWLGEDSPDVTDQETQNDREFLSRLLSFHPGDAGILFVQLMHRIRLARGEGIFVQPGEVHAYVEGFGVEVMLPSDNVVRAGLTTKHQDRDAFFEIAQFSETTSAPVVMPATQETTSHYQGFGGPCEVLEVSAGASTVLVAPTVLICETGSMRVAGATETITVDEGDVVFVTPQEQEISFSGQGTAWLVWPAR
jgi:mannose-6-phosphate isomerase